MLHFITAISPEADAVRSFYSMKRLNGERLPSGLTVFTNDDHTVFLLVTGSGKLAATAAVSEYLAFLASDSFPRPISGNTACNASLPTASDVSALYESSYFCNLGICGAADSALVGKAFLCAAVHDISSQKSLYPELYTHPFSEAVLATADRPVTRQHLAALLSSASDTVSSEPVRPLMDKTHFPVLSAKTNLPLLFDMEGFGVLYALTRRVRPSHCFLAKVVSDACEEKPITPAEVTSLLSGVLPQLETFFRTLSETPAKALPDITAEKEYLCSLFPFSETMTHKLTHLLSYAKLTGIGMQAAVAEEIQQLSAVKNPCAKGFTKKEAGLFLAFLEQYLHTQNLRTYSPHSTKNSKKKLRLFSHIYVETEVLDHPVTLKLLKRYPKASVIPIRHYKDIFNRSRQELSLQETEPSFILAANHSAKFYPGAPVCQSFGEEHFYYTSCIMNCIYDCDYCYLQGMYPTGNIVVFVNTDDYFAELTELLSKHPVYLCCSYDSDLTALSGLFPHAEQFCRFAAFHPSLRLELRTKCSNPSFLAKLPAAKNILMAFTLSPQEVIDCYEHYTPSLHARLACAKLAAKRGFSLRLCLDPVLDVPNACELYTKMIDTIFTVLSPEDITDLSLGVFRISKDYLKQLRIAKPACAFSHYPYTITNGVCHYSDVTAQRLLSAITEALTVHGLSREKLYFWQPEEHR